jgi:hypothetical protein
MLSAGKVAVTEVFGTIIVIEVPCGAAFFFYRFAQEIVLAR